MRAWFFLWVANHFPPFRIFDNYRYLLLKWAGMRIRYPCLIYGPLTVRPIKLIRNVKIDKNSFLNTGIRFECLMTIKIGSNCQIGPNVSFETVSHGLDFVDGRGRGTYSKEIIVEDKVWIGAGAIILQGVIIGEGAVVSAGAVVKDSIPAKTLYGGVPARFIKRLI